MATAFAMLETYSNLRETLAGATEKAKVAAERVRAQVAEQTKGLTVSRAKELVAGFMQQQQESTGSSNGAGGDLEAGAGAGAGSKAGQQQETKQGSPEQPPAAASEDASQPLLDDLHQACNLTFKQRVYGFASCLSLGFLCCILSLFVLFQPVKFGLAYSLGNLLSLSSTGFLIGFKRQLTMMLDPVRRVAALVFVVMAVVTLFVALLVQDPLLTLLCILVQSSALTWYSLSYIPYAQAAVKRMARLFINSEF